jgi:hypothetical protein
MPASSSDLLRKGTASGRPESAYLTSSKAVGATTMTISTTTGWATDTGTDFVMFRKDANDKVVAGTLTTWVGTVSGLTINNMVLQAGTEPVGGYPSGEQSVVIATPTAAWSAALMTALLTSLDQDGTLKAGAVDNAAVLASSTVATASIQNSAVTSAKLAPTKSTDANGWTMYDEGTYKVYKKRVTGAANKAVGEVFTFASSGNLPVGISSVGTNFVNASGSIVPSDGSAGGLQATTASTSLPFVLKNIATSTINFTGFVDFELRTP